MRKATEYDKKKKCQSSSSRPSFKGVIVYGGETHYKNGQKSFSRFNHFQRPVTINGAFRPAGSKLSREFTRKRIPSSLRKMLRKGNLL